MQISDIMTCVRRRIGNCEIMDIWEENKSTMKNVNYDENIKFSKVNAPKQYRTKSSDICKYMEQLRKGADTDADMH